MVPMTAPPMMPDDIEDDEIEDFGQIDDEDEDSSCYDLTGMSEKLQSIPKETIQVTPKEVVLPPVNSGAPDQNGFTKFESIPPNEFTNFENISPGLNSTELRVEQLPPDGKSDHDENDEIPNSLNSEIHIPNSLNNKIHIPTNTISSIEPTNDEPKTAFDTANSIDVELNSTVEPNNF